MHPPWITFNFLLLLFVITNTTSEDSAEQNESANSTISRPQREIYERERRLIPYMTYYVTQNIQSPNGGVRQNILIPVTSQRGNIYHVGAVPKIPLSNIQNVNPLPLEVLPKPVVRLTGPTLLTPTVQAGQYKAKESGILPQIYNLEPEIGRPRIQVQLQQQQIQSETQPLQVVKVNAVSTEQKYAAPQIIKILPVVAKLPSEGSPIKTVNPPPSNFVYPGRQIPALVHRPITLNYQHYYKEPVASPVKSSFQENKIYASHNSQQNVQPQLIGPTLAQGTNKYPIAKVVLSTTTPSPYEAVKFNANDGKASTIGNNEHQFSIAHLRQSNPIPLESALSTVPSFANEKYVALSPSQQPLYYDQTENGGQGQTTQDLINSQKAERLPKLRVPEEEKIRFVASVTQVPVTNDLESVHWKVNNQGTVEKLYNKEPLNNIFSLLKETNKLPQNLTPDNIDTGIKTLALILERLQQQRNFYQTSNGPISGSSTPEPPRAATATENRQKTKKVHNFPEKSGTSTPGRPGIDYPTYSTIPQTNFDCSTQRYKGFFGDPDTNCQVWHYCDLNGGQASFLCPNGTIFSQVALTCDWWFNVKCASTSQLYVLNERLYKYILPFSPSFPEDYSGPVVDTYLEARFKEMEAKSKLKKSKTNTTTTETPEITTEEPTDSPVGSAEDYPTQSTEV